MNMHSSKEVPVHCPTTMSCSMQQCHATSVSMQMYTMSPHCPSPMYIGESPEFCKS